MTSTNDSHDRKSNICKQERARELAEAPYLILWGFSKTREQIYRSDYKTYRETGQNV